MPTTTDDADGYDARLLSARLTPHRSLGPRGFRILLIAVGFVSLVWSLPFVVMGAWPVAGFMGLDVALVYFAFRASYRAARAYEDILVTPLELSLAKVSARGARREWRFSPSFVRLERQEHEEYGVMRLDLVSRGRRVEVAGFLGPDAKADFARDLSQALHKARRGPRFS